MRKEAARSAEASENKGIRNNENIKTEKLVDENVEKSGTKAHKEYVKREE